MAAVRVKQNNEGKGPSPWGLSVKWWLPWELNCPQKRHRTCNLHTWGWLQSQTAKWGRGDLCGFARRTYWGIHFSKLNWEEPSWNQTCCWCVVIWTWEQPWRIQGLKRKTKKWRELPVSHSTWPGRRWGNHGLLPLSRGLSNSTPHLPRKFDSLRLNKPNIFSTSTCILGIIMNSNVFVKTYISWTFFMWIVHGGSMIVPLILWMSIFHIP